MLADAAFHSSASKILSDQVVFWNIPTNDLWCRDSGPIIAFDDLGQRVVSHIQFNGWANKQHHNHDAQIAKRVVVALDFNVISPGLVGEAGGIETNGAGTLIAHESSWINDNRNPTLSKDQISKRLLAAYGADQIMWSKGAQVWTLPITTLTAWPDLWALNMWWPTCQRGWTDMIHLTPLPLKQSQPCGIVV